MERQNQLTSSESLFGLLPDYTYNFGFHGSKQLSMGNERVVFGVMKTFMTTEDG